MAVVEEGLTPPLDWLDDDSSNPRTPFSISMASSMNSFPLQSVKIIYNKAS